MKKLVLVLAVAFSATLFSCGGDKKADKAATDSCCKDSAKVETPDSAAKGDSTSKEVATPDSAKTEAPADSAKAAK